MSGAGGKLGSTPSGGPARGAHRHLYESMVNRLSHELGGPLAVLRGYVSLWLDGTLDPEPWCTREDIGSLAEIIDALTTEVRMVVASVGPSELASASTDLDAWVATLGSQLRGSVADLRGWFRARDRNTALQMRFSSAHAALVCERSVILFGSLVNQLEAVQEVHGDSLPQLEPIELGEWVRKSLHEIAPVVTCFGHRVVVDFPPRPAVVMANSEMLAMALVNILDNAQKFSAPQTRIQLTVFESATAAGFSVDDEGPGLPRGFALRLFGRIDEDRGFASPGMGLGLYIANQVAKLFAGKLTFRSIERVGTSFRLELPRVQGVV